jgi:hypothetical protein
VIFAAITLCVASQRVFIVVVAVVFISLSTRSGNFWIHTRMCIGSAVRPHETTEQSVLCIMVFVTKRTRKEQCI